MVPDVIEKSPTYQKLARHVSTHAGGCVSSFGSARLGGRLLFLSVLSCVLPRKSLHQSPFFVRPQTRSHQQNRHQNHHPKQFNFVIAKIVAAFVFLAGILATIASKLGCARRCV
jgi:hypothetical protein